MSERQIMIKILEKMPDTISMDDILETMLLINDLKNRVNNFNENEATTQEDLKKEIEEW